MWTFLQRQTTIWFDKWSIEGWSFFFLSFFLNNRKKDSVRVLSLLWVSVLLCCVSQPTVVYMLFKWWIMHRLLHETLRFPVGIRLSKLFPKANTHPRTLPPQAPIHYSFYSNSGATHQALPLASRLHQQPQPPRSLMDFIQPPDKYVMNRLTSGLTDYHSLLNNREFPAKQDYGQLGSASKVQREYWHCCFVWPFTPWKITIW